MADMKIHEEEEGHDDSFMASSPQIPALWENLDIQGLKRDLLTATKDLSDRGLYHAAKWTAELVVQIVDEDEEGGMSTIQGRAKIKPGSASKRAPSTPTSEEEQEHVALAKTYFDLREYARAAYVLEGYKGHHARFLRSYSRYLAGERSRLEEMQQKREPLARAKVTNRALRELENELGTLYRNTYSETKDNSSVEALDPFCMYLYGLVLKQLDRNDLATEALVRSVNAYPFNWSAWRCLTSLVKSKESVSKLGLEDHCIKQMFLADVYLELQHHETSEVMDILQALIEVFPKSTHLNAQLAMAYYNMRDFDEAQQLFQDLHVRDPWRLSSMDVYSNILFVKECKAELSFLAHTAIKTDKYRPETCCIIGNYYSLKGEHERAVIYFKRALRLDPSYLSAWTLMGHEYVEMRNSAAAIEAYRRAVDINPRDYRAWYGLGQTYEIMRMHNYALYYFRKATKLRPYDARMWCAMGDTFDRLSRYEDAIKCYKQAEGNEDPEGSAILKLANAYKKTKDNDTAAAYFRKVLQQREAEGGGSIEERRDNADALLFLARHCKGKGLMQECERYCNRLLDIGGTVKDEAKSILEEMRERRRHPQS